MQNVSSQEKIKIREDKLPKILKKLWPNERRSLITFGEVNIDIIILGQGRIHTLFVSSQINKLQITNERGKVTLIEYDVIKLPW